MPCVPIRGTQISFTALASRNKLCRYLIRDLYNSALMILAGGTNGSRSTLEWPERTIEIRTSKQGCGDQDSKFTVARGIGAGLRRIAGAARLFRSERAAALLRSSRHSCHTSCVQAIIDLGQKRQEER